MLTKFVLSYDVASGSDITLCIEINILVML